MKDLLITFLFIGAVMFFLKSSRGATQAAETTEDRTCYCFWYYNKQAKHSKRIYQETCDTSIFQFNDRFEIFKVVVDCDSPQIGQMEN